MFSRFTRALLCSLFPLAAFAAAPAAPSSNVVVVLNSNDATVTLIDQEKYTEVGRFSVGKEPHHLMATPDNKSLIVASSVGNELIFLDPKSGQLQRRMPGILDPYQIGFSPDQKWFVSNSLRLDRVDIYKYDGTNMTLSKRVPLPKTPSHMAFTADSSTVFITQQGSDQVSAIDVASGTVKWTLPVGKLPAGIVMTPDDKYLLVGIMGADYIEVIDWRLKKTVKRIKCENGTHNFRALGDKKTLFVSNREANVINIVDMTTLENVGAIKVPGAPDDMEITEDGKTMWTTLRWSRRVAVIDLTTRKVITTVKVGNSPHGIYFNNHSPRM